MRDDIAETRADLGETTEPLAAKTDVKTRTADAARRAASSLRIGSRQQAVRVQESVQRQPRRWAGAGVLTLAVAAVGAAMWQRSRRRPQPRAARVWQAVTRRFSR